MNHRDVYQQTPIYYAAREGHYELTQKLIELGANVNNEDINGQTVLFYSAREGHRNISELLIKHGAIPNKKDKKRQTPMYWAKKNNRMEVIELLGRYGAVQPKERTEKTRSGKKSGKRRTPEANEVKKYILTICRNGEHREATPEEFKAFIESNKDLAIYFNDLNALRMPEVSPNVAIYDHWDKAARKIVSYLWKQTGAYAFHAPVDPAALQIPDYYKIIKKPMDLGTIKRKLAGFEYAKCQDFIDDVELVFNNTITYNGETSEYGKLGKKMLADFASQCKSLCLNYYM